MNKIFFTLLEKSKVVNLAFQRKKSQNNRRNLPFYNPNKYQISKHLNTIIYKYQSLFRLRYSVFLMSS